MKIQKHLHNDPDNILPSSYYEARRMINPYIVKKKVFSVCPNDCVIFRNSVKYSYGDLKTCPVCSGDRFVNNNAKRLVSKRKFIYIPIGPRLARIFGEVNLAQLVQSHPGDGYDNDDMWDIHHSPVWRELYSADGYFAGNKTGISYALELDGVNPFHNIGVIYSMIPINLTILNLPRHVRNAFGNINLVGIIPGNGKSESSNLEPYLEVLVDELIFLSGCKAYSAYNMAPFDVKIKLLLYVLDYPGLSKLFHQIGSGGLSGCHWCFIRGIRCDHLDKVIYLSNRSYLEESDFVRQDETKFIDKAPDLSRRPKLRTNDEETSYREAYEKSKNKTQASIVATATGCKGNYILSSLPGHNRITESQPDSCHTIKDVTQNIMNFLTGYKVDVHKALIAENKLGRLKDFSLGSSEHEDACFNDDESEKHCKDLSGSKKRKRLTNKKTNKKIASTNIFSSQRIPYLLTKDELNRADERAKSIRVPLGFGLKASPFISKTYCLKSHDWKQLATQGILKYCLKGMLSDQCRETLFLLFDSLTELCQEKVNSDDTDLIELRLNKALALFEREFPVCLQNITTHILHHIPDGINRYGPVYGTWMFVYERFNSWICKRVLNMRYPEATAIETFLIHDWCHFMLSSGHVSLDTLDATTELNHINLCAVGGDTETAAVDVNALAARKQCNLPVQL